MIRLALASCNASAEAVGRLLDGGTLRLYDGRRPALPDDPVADGQKLLAEFRFGDPAFEPAQGGAILAHKIADTVGLREGVVQWFRCERADGGTVLDGAFTDSEMDLRINVRDVMPGARISVQALAIEQPVF